MVCSALGDEGGFFSLTGEADVERAGEALSDPLSLDPDRDLDLFTPGEADFDFVLLLFLGDLDLLLPGSGECDLDR